MQISRMYMSWEGKKIYSGEKCIFVSRYLKKKALEILQISVIQLVCNTSVIKHEKSQQST